MHVKRGALARLIVAAKLGSKSGTGKGDGRETEERGPREKLRGRAAKANDARRRKGCARGSARRLPIHKKLPFHKGK